MPFTRKAAIGYNLVNLLQETKLYLLSIKVGLLQKLCKYERDHSAIIALPVVLLSEKTPLSEKQYTNKNTILLCEHLNISVTIKTNDNSLMSKLNSGRWSVI